ncbi:MAG: hypothetical protein Q9170_003066 [Blastenia crenularia]
MISTTARVLATTAAFWLLCVCLCTITWVQRQIFYAHWIPIWVGQDLDKPEILGFLKNQVAQFYIQTPDDQSLYAWLIIPLRVYAKNENSSLEGKASNVIAIQDTLAFEFLTECPESRVVLYFHGNARTRGQTRKTEAYRTIASEASDKIFVLAFDYRGFGRCTGSPTGSGLVIDAIAAVEWLLGQLEFRQLVSCYLHSLGTGLACAAANHFVKEDPAIEFASIMLYAAFSDTTSAFLSYAVGGILPLLWPLRRSKRLQRWFSVSARLHK